MRNLILLFSIITYSLLSCKKSDIEKPPTEPPVGTPSSTFGLDYMEVEKISLAPTCTCMAILVTAHLPVR